MIMEDYTRGMWLMKKKFNWSGIINMGPGGHQYRTTDEFEHKPHVKELLEERNRLDMFLYEWARQLNNWQIGRAVDFSELPSMEDTLKDTKPFWEEHGCEGPAGSNNYVNTWTVGGKRYSRYGDPILDIYRRCLMDGSLDARQMGVSGRQAFDYRHTLNKLP